MSMVRVYLYGIDRKVLIPKMSQTEDGMLVETAPVEMFDVTDVDTWKAHVYKQLVEGLKYVKGKDQSTNPGSAILEKLNIGKWSDFERFSVMYIIHRGPKFISVYSTGRAEDGMWTQGKSHRTFHPRAPLDIVVTEMVMDLLKEPEAFKKEPRLLLG